jgi:vacuolar protein sorting-associated protein 13A/C
LYGLELKRGALDFLDLPIAVESGIAGCLKIIIPWDKLTVKPVVLTINDVWLISKPLSSFDFTKETEEDLESKWQKKLNEIKKMQERWEKQQAKRWGGIHEAKSVSLVDRVIFSIMQLIEVRINHVHVLFEDTTSDEKKSIHSSFGYRQYCFTIGFL